MKDVEEFFSLDEPADRVVGTYIYPYCLLSEPSWDDSLSPTEVIQRVETDKGEILVTRNGGLFIEPPTELTREINLSS